MLQNEEDRYGYQDWYKPEYKPGLVGLFFHHDLRKDDVYRGLCDGMGRLRIQVAKAMVRFGQSHRQEINRHLFSIPPETRVPNRLSTLIGNMGQDPKVQRLYTYLRGLKDAEEEYRRSNEAEVLAQAAPHLADPSSPVTVEEYCSFLDSVFRSSEETSTNRRQAGLLSLKLRGLITPAGVDGGGGGPDRAMDMSLIADDDGDDPED